MRQIMAAIAALVIALSSATNCAAEYRLVPMWSNDDVAVYGTNNPASLGETAQYISVNLVAEPLSAHMISQFSRASGGLEPGFVLLTYVFDKSAPRYQIARSVFYGANGGEKTINTGVDNKQWKPLQPGHKLHEIRRVLTGR